MVVVVACTLRADQTSPYGAPAAVSPALSALAAEGARFERLIASAPWTRAAATALLTGRDALAVGVSEPGPGPDLRGLPPGLPTLAERLQGAGWHTVGVSANPNVGADFGFGRGFARRVDLSARWDGGGEKWPGEEVVARALGELEGRPPEAPVYLELVLVDPHLPRQADAAALRPFQGPGVSPVLATYRAEVRRLDGAVGALREGLAARDLAPEHTVFAVVGDHGEGLDLPEGAGRSHGFALDAAALHVPWVVAGPGVAPAGVVGGLASQLDFAPTLLGLAGVAGAEGLPGLDWSGALAGGASPGAREAVYAHTGFRWAERVARYDADGACQIDLNPTGTSEAPELPGRPAFVEGCTGAGPAEQRMETLRGWYAERLAERAVWGEAPVVGVEGGVEAGLRGLGYLE